MGNDAFKISVLVLAMFSSFANAPPASAQDIFDGGRLGGGSSQFTAENLPGSANPLPEFGGQVNLNKFQGTWY